MGYVLNSSRGREKRGFRSLRVYRRAIDASFEIFLLTKGFPYDERFSLGDQIRRSSRSVCANLAEAWSKRRYKAAFISKLNDAESEASETQVWLEIAERCGYPSHEVRLELDDTFDHIIAQIVRMMETADSWLLPRK